MKIISSYLFALILSLALKASNIELPAIELSEACSEAWQKAYCEYLLSLGDTAFCYTYSLIYVDDDNIPELVLNSSSNFGNEVLTYHDNVLDILFIYRQYFSYIERENLLCNRDGIMGQYYDTVYTIAEGKWIQIAEGRYGDGDNGVQYDENGNYIEYFFWNAETVTQPEYEAHLNTIYPVSQEKWVYEFEKSYSFTDILSLLITGKVTSANHRYEFVVSDVPWTYASDTCQYNGGYLATITSYEELKHLQEMIVSEEKTDILFLVGACRAPYGDYHWYEPEEKRDLLSTEHPFFLRGYYSTIAEDGTYTYIETRYVALVYDASEGRCGLLEIPNDPLTLFPSYAGKIGYICEYD